MRVKKLIICIVLIIAICVGIGVCSAFFRNAKDDEMREVLVIDSREDLSELLEYDFKNVDIAGVYSDDASRCLCVVLDESYEEFSKDNVVEGSIFDVGDGKVTFNYLKEIFPDIFVMNSSDIKNENGTGKYYEFYFGDNYSEFEPYYVFWFSTQLDRKEKCVIYAFLPDKIEEITVKNIV